MSNIEERYVSITDVTMREGDQAPFTSFNEIQKKVISLMLSEMGVDTIEVGFGANKSDFNNIKEVSKVIGNYDVEISSLGRSVVSDTQSSLEALKGVKNPRIHIFAAMSKEHIKGKFQKEGMTFEEAQSNILKEAINNIKIVKKYEENNNTKIKIEFSPEDATGNALVLKEGGKKYFKLNDNPDFEFLVKVCEETIKAGANVINVPDTLGNLTSNQTYDFFVELNKRLDSLKKDYNFGLSSHIHNDLASSTENTIQAIRGGADYVETTLLGIGERAGNASTEEVAGVITEKGHDLSEGVNIKLNPKFKTELIGPISYFVSKIIGLDKSLQKPFVGALSDRDGSGVHNANEDLYGGSKNKKKYGGAELPEFFSARGGTSQLISMLGNYGIKIDKKQAGEIIENFGKKAETNKALYGNNIYTEYLEQKGEYKINRLEIENNNLDLEILLNGKIIELNGKIEGKNGIINTFIKLLNDEIDNKNIKIKDLQIKSKPDLKTEINYFRKRAGNLLSENFNKNMDSIVKDIENKPNSESKAITQVILDIDGEEIYSISSDNNTTKSGIKAILEGVIDIL